MHNRLLPIAGLCLLAFQPLHIAYADSPAAPATASTAVTAPLTVASDGKFCVDATIDGKGPYSLLIDTGSEVMVLKSSVAQACGLTIKTGTVQVQGPTGGYVPVGQAEVDTVTIAGLTINKPFCTAEDIDLPCDGIIGAPLFNAGVVRLDFAGSKLTTYGSDFTPDPEDTALALNFGARRVPIVDGAVGGIDAKLEVDTGSSFPAELNADFIADHDLTDMFSKIGSEQHTSISGAAVADVYDVQSISLGNVKIRGRIPALFLPPNGAPKRDFDGRVGCPLLSGTVMTFDYPNGKMYLQRSSGM